MSHEGPVLRPLPFFDRISLDVLHGPADVLGIEQKHRPTKLRPRRRQGTVAFGTTGQRVQTVGDQLERGAALQMGDNLLNAVLVPKNHQVRVFRQDRTGTDRIA